MPASPGLSQLPSSLSTMTRPDRWSNSQRAWALHLQYGALNHRQAHLTELGEEEYENGLRNLVAGTRKKETLAHLLFPL